MALRNGPWTHLLSVGSGGKKWGFQFKGTPPRFVFLCRTVTPRVKKREFNFRGGTDEQRGREGDCFFFFFPFPVKRRAELSGNEAEEEEGRPPPLKPQGGSPLRGGRREKKERKRERSEEGRFPQLGGTFRLILSPPFKLCNVKGTRSTRNGTAYTGMETN